MKELPTLLSELGSQLDQLEYHARNLKSDVDTRDIVVTISLFSILKILEEEEILNKLFMYSHYNIAITTLLSRIYVVLELMYLNDTSQFIEIEAYAQVAVKHIWILLKKYAWNF